MSLIARIVQNKTTNGHQYTHTATAKMNSTIDTNVLAQTWSNVTSIRWWGRVILHDWLGVIYLR